MFGPELHAENATGAVRLAPINYDDLPETVDPQVTEYLTDYFRDFVMALPEQYEWLERGADNLHWGIYDKAANNLLGITGVRNLGADKGPAVSRIALFANGLRSRGIGSLAYCAQYEYLKRSDISDLYEHVAANGNIGSLRIAARVGFVAIHNDGQRTTMHLHINAAKEKPGEE